VIKNNTRKVNAKLQDSTALARDEDAHNTLIVNRYQDRVLQPMSPPNIAISSNTVATADSKNERLSKARRVKLGCTLRDTKLKDSSVDEQQARGEVEVTALDAKVSNVDHAEEVRQAIHRLDANKLDADKESFDETDIDGVVVDKSLVDGTDIGQRSPEHRGPDRHQSATASDQYVEKMNVSNIPNVDKALNVLHGPSSTRHGSITEAFEHAKIFVKSLSPVDGYKKLLEQAMKLTDELWNENDAMQMHLQGLYSKNTRLEQEHDNASTQLKAKEQEVKNLKEEIRGRIDRGVKAHLEHSRDEALRLFGEVRIRCVVRT
jgi:hypothetical protein